MKVFLTYTTDAGGDNKLVDKVFASRRDAENHIIDDFLVYDKWHEGMTRAELEKASQPFVDEREVKIS